MMRWFLVVVVGCAIAGCYAPRLDRCQVTCTDACPAAQACLDDGFCHVAGDLELCTPDAASSEIDATPGFDTIPSIDAEVPTQFRTVSVGGYHVCAIDEGGRLWCWGANRYGQLGIDEPLVLRRATPTQVGTDTTWTAVDTGSSTTCGINAGALYCWGSNSYGEAIDQNHGSGAVYAPEEADSGPDDGWIAVALTSRSTCAIHDDGAGTRTLYCAGADYAGQRGDGGGETSGPELTAVTTTSAGPVSDWTSITAGIDHLCAQRDDGSAYCWGQNTLGQIGNGTTTPATIPSRVVDSVADGPVTFAALGLGDVMTCGVGAAGALAGRLYCWGGNGYGQLGTAAVGQSLAPLRIGTATDWSTIAAGYLGACGTRTAGAYCWGDGGRGISGNGAWSYQSTPQKVLGLDAVMPISVGYQAACAAPPSGGVQCWGENREGELGNGETSAQHTPTQVLPADGLWTAVAAGAEHTCGVHDGQVMCWGWNEDREAFGTASPEGATVPTAVVGITGTATEVSVGRYASCAIADGLPWCWGHDTHGEVGVNAGIGAYVTPTRIASVGVWHQLRQTKEATCAQVGTQRRCWGDGADYGLGNNATGNVATPVAADALAWDQISLGAHFGCGISDGPKQMWCWGSDAYQTQGDGATVTTATIPQTLGAPSYARVAASWSGDHVCAIASSGALWCWGANTYGQCGVTAGSTPLAVPTSIDTGAWQQLAAGPLHTCATKNAATDLGQLWCWGAHTDKQLGIDRDVAYEDTPQRVGTDLEWTAVSAGTWHTCGLRGGNLYCWGMNLHGQLGVGTSAHNTPVAVGFP